MVPSLQWLLLLWGLQGLWAQDYEEDYEEEAVTTKKKNRQFPSNVIAQNGKCKSKIVSFLHLPEGVFPLMLLLGKVVWNMCRWNMFHFFHHQKKKKVLLHVKLQNMILNKDIAGGCSPLGSYLLDFSEPSISCVTAQCSVTQMFYSLRILFPQAHSLCDIFP